MERDEVMKGDGANHDTAQRCDESGYCSQRSRFHFLRDGRDNNWKEGAGRKSWGRLSFPRLKSF